MIPRSTHKYKCIVAEEDFGATTKEGVYAGGDAVTGAATVILAMGAGKAAAKGIDEYDMAFRAETQRSSRSIHRHVSSTHDSHLLTEHNGCIGSLVERLHQVASGQILVGGENAQRGAPCEGGGDHF